MYRVELRHSQDMAFKVKAGSDEFVIDAKGQGLTPLHALLAGLGSCVGVYLRKYEEGAKLGLADFDITVEAELEKAQPVSFRTIKVSLDLKGKNLDDRRQKALLEFIKNCPVHNTLKGNPDVEVKIL